MSTVSIFLTLLTCIYVILIYLSKEEQPTVMVAQNLCKDDEHNLEEKTYIQLKPASSYNTGVVATLQDRTRMECTKCTHKEEWGVPTNIEDVYEVELNMEDYKNFMDDKKVFHVFSRNSDIIVSRANKKEK